MNDVVYIHKSSKNPVFIKGNYKDPGRMLNVNILHVVRK